MAWLTALVSFGLLLGIFEEGGLERNVGSMWAPTKTHREMLAEIGGKNQTEIGRERGTRWAEYSADAFEDAFQQGRDCIIYIYVAV